MNKPPIPPIRERPGVVLITNVIGLPIYSDPEMPAGTIEVWQDGKLIGRIESIPSR